ncbi:hypothetical protein CspeluHIS016_0803600 [Cutaneotrichosporon spelunceum]|uniref:Uncharacterized protein n=1 Tax=Cutaneotrichosporon spelunceum TaxID=1672016 RepID=A0AAD3YF60_9TREE|nr:hypothetical protein CspeluHIS016_0803600 [Cutaneotrichosporon spelunceum]
MVCLKPIDTAHVLKMIRTAWQQVDEARTITQLNLDPTPEAVQQTSALLPRLTSVLENMIMSDSYTALDLEAWHGAYSQGILAMRRAAQAAGHPIFPGHIYSFILATGPLPGAEISPDLCAAVKGAGEVGCVLLCLERARTRRRRLLGASLPGEPTASLADG